VERLKDYGPAQAYHVTRQVLEIGSGREFPPPQVFETAHQCNDRFQSPADFLIGWIAAQFLPLPAHAERTFF
jgi:hypothetical protein